MSHISQIVSLGGNCAIAFHLKKYNYIIRYPFDWCNMSIYQLNQVLENNFDYFTKLKIVKLSESHQNFQTLQNQSYILKNYYNIKFAHEISNKYNLDDFQLVLQKRIYKFYQLKNPTFIRLETRNISDEFFNKQYQKLIDNLHKYFQDFKLIIIAKNNSFTTKYNVTFIKLEDFSKDWTYSNLNWKEIIEI